VGGHTVTISVSDAGSYVEATDLYVAHDGEWVHVPRGGWTRPPDWLPTNVAVGEQKIQCLLHLGGVGSPESDRVHTIYQTGAYTVNWGDGTTPQNFGAGVTSTHLYDPNNLTGPLTSTGRKQALVTITAQAGQTLQYINFAQPYYGGKNWQSSVVEVVVGPGINNFYTGGVCPWLERIEFLTPMVMASGNSMFSNIRSLREIIGTVSVTGTSADYMFQGCASLVKLPIILTPNITTAINMFSGCTLLPSIPSFYTGKIANWSSMFNACASLVEATLDLVAATNITNLFSGCFLLRTVTLSNMALVQNANGLFTSCYALRETNPLDLSGVTSAANLVGLVANCTNLRKLPFLAGKGPRFTFTVNSTILAGTELDALYTALPTVTGQTITVTSVFGGTTDNPAIATAKGWTVTGS
jgi:BspA type Leucine rich repeat region (6 copies)